MGGILDRIDYNGKFQIVLMSVIAIEDEARQEKSLNNSFALSSRQLQRVLALFNLNEVEQRDLNASWAVYLPMRRGRTQQNTNNTSNFNRDQASILINVGTAQTSRIFIRPAGNLSEAERQHTLAAMEEARNPTRLFDLLGELKTELVSRPRQNSQNRSHPGGGKGGGQPKHGGGQQRPKTPQTPHQPPAKPPRERERGDRRSHHDESEARHRPFAQLGSLRQQHHADHAENP